MPKKNKPKKNPFSLVASLALWTRRLAFRRARYAAAQAAHDGPRQKKWHSLILEAKHAVEKRQAQLEAKTPLRIRAFLEAEKLVGVLESGGNNNGPEVSRIIRANGGVVGEPWCGDFVAFVFKLAGSKTVQRAFASTIWLLASLTSVKNPLKGHVVVYHFGSGGAKHTGLFEKWIDRPRGLFWAIEGNTGKDGAVSDSTAGGDGVHRRQRHINQVAGFRKVIG